MAEEAQNQTQDSQPATSSPTQITSEIPLPPPPIEIEKPIEIEDKKPPDQPQPELGSQLPSTPGSAPPPATPTPGAQTQLPPPPLPTPSQTPSQADFKSLARQARIKKLESRLGKVLALAKSKSRITNDDIQKFLRVSDATATRYLQTLIKRGLLRKSGKTKSAYYEAI